MHIIFITLCLLLLIVLFIAVFRSISARNALSKSAFDLKPCNFGSLKYEQNLYELEGEYEGIFSFSMYGEYTRFVPKIFTNIDVIKGFFPTWKCRFYVDNTIGDDVFEKLRRVADVVIMEREGQKGTLNFEGSLWRFLAAAEDKPFVMLDADDIMTKREAKLIDAWYKSDYKWFFGDGTYSYCPIMAKNWGGRARAIPDMEERINKYCETWFGFDECFLYNEIWPLVKDDTKYVGMRMNTWLMTIAIFAVIFIVMILMYTKLVRMDERYKLKAGTSDL